MCVCVRVCVCVCLSMCVLCLCVYIYIYIQIYIHKYTYVCKWYGEQLCRFKASRQEYVKEQTDAQKQTPDTHAEIGF